MNEQEIEQIRDQIRSYGDDSGLLWQMIGWYKNRLESSAPEKTQQAIDFFRTLDILSRPVGDKKGLD